MLLSLLETHTCKSMILVRMAAILFLCKFGIQKPKPTPQKMTFICSAYQNMI